MAAAQGTLIVTGQPFREDPSLYAAGCGCWPLPNAEVTSSTVERPIEYMLEGINQVTGEC